MRLQHIDHVAITVKDLEPSRAWYRDVLGLERRFEDEWGDVPTVMCAGDTCVAMFPAATRDPKRTPGTDTIAMRHVAFRVDAANFTAAQAEFRERHPIRILRSRDRALGLYLRSGWPPHRDHDVRSVAPPPGGSAWESNPPRTVLPPYNGFEDREAHRDPSTPADASIN
jgi:catechol 2,3-dioxygenase-like lactoylglutathione lyase family enzyme